MPENSYIIAERVDAALQDTIALLDGILKEVGVIFASVGVNEKMDELLMAAASSFDWGTLAHEAPGQLHVDAFQKYVALARPMLEQTLYPAGADFAAVPHAWPCDADLVTQYEELCRRVRLALRVARQTARRQKPEAYAFHSWERAAGCTKATKRP